MPSNTVVEVYNDLISPSHKVTRGSIGIEFRKTSGAVNRVYGFKNGVLVQRSTRRPRGQGRIKVGDIITTIDGRPSRTATIWSMRSPAAGPGSTIRLGYLRDGKQATPR
jgi:serine protease Do